MNKKTLLAAALLAILLIQNNTVSATTETESSITINTSIKSAILDVSIPVSHSLVIDPNLDISVIGTSIPIKNNNGFPISVTLKNITLSEANGMTIVAPDTYAKWWELSKDESNSKLAVGVKQASNFLEPNEDIIWSTETNNGTTPVFIGGVRAYGTAYLQFEFKTGTALNRQKDIALETVFIIDML